MDDIARPLPRLMSRRVYLCQFCNKRQESGLNTFQRTQYTPALGVF